MSKTVTSDSSIVLTADAGIGLGIDRTGKPVSVLGGIAVGVSATSGKNTETIRVDHGPICEAKSGAAIDGTNPYVQWDATGRLIPYTAGAGIFAAGILAQAGNTATAADQWVRFYPAIFK